jgi:PAS domain S-box-containing protein
LTTTVIGTIVILAELAVIAVLLVHRRSLRLAEAESKKSHDRYRSVVDTQTDLVCRFRPDLTLTFVNDAYCLFWKKSREELLGKKFTELIPPAARAGVLERIGRLTSGFDAHEHQVTLPDGTTGWHHWINHAILDSEGHLTELQGVGRDVTDRKRAEEALQQVEARNTAILRAIPDLMFIVDRGGTYLDYHTRDQTALFAPPSQFLGRKMQEILPAGPREKLERALARAKVAETVIVEYTLPMPQPPSFGTLLIPRKPSRATGSWQVALLPARSWSGRVSRASCTTASARRWPALPWTSVTSGRMGSRPRKPMRWCGRWSGGRRASPRPFDCCRTDSTPRC